MLPRLDVITVTPVNGVDRVSASEAVADPRQQALSRSLQTMLGKTMQAEVLSRLTDGSFVVRVNGNAARMQLPAGAQVGGEVALKLVGLEPRPTFEVGGGTGRTAATAYAETAPASAPGARAAAEPAALAPRLQAELAARAPRTQADLAAPAARTPATDPALAPALASPGGQRAAAAAGGGPALRPSSYAATLLSKAPLTPSDQLPALDADSQPAALSQAARTITSVLSVAMQAPQPSPTVVAKTPLLVAPGTSPIAPEKLAAALHEAVGNSGLFYESHLGEWSAGARPLAALMLEPQMQGALATTPVRSGQTEAIIADPATAQFISQQLSTQEQGRIAWQGQLWPGQELRWEISRDLPQHGARQENGEPPEAPWRSGVRFRFPLLGEIGATVVLAGDQLHIQVESGAGEVRDLLRAHAARLETALAAAGAPLASLTVRATDGKSDG
jgi:hypothetical protein